MRNLKANRIDLISKWTSITPLQHNQQELQLQTQTDEAK